MKILQLCPDYPPYVRGGGAQTYKILADEWKREGHEVEVIASVPSALANKQTVASDGGECDFFRLIGAPEGLREASYFMPMQPGEMLRLHRTLKVKAAASDRIVIHGIMETMPLLSLLLLRRFPDRILLVDHAVSTAEHTTLFRLLSRIMYRTIGKLAVGRNGNILVFGDRSRMEFIDYFGTQHAPGISVVPLGIDVTEFADCYGRAMERESQLSKWLSSYVQQNCPFILSIGRNVRTKGFDVLIRSFSETVKRYPDAVLLIAGDAAAHTSELKQLAEELHLTDRIHFMGRVTEEEKVFLMVKCALLAIPSLKEGYGLNAVEADILGVPVVATRTGAHEQILHGSRSCLFVQPGDEKELTRSLSEMLSRPRLPSEFRKDEAARFDMRELSRKYLDTFSGR